MVVFTNTLYEKNSRNEKEHMLLHKRQSCNLCADSLVSEDVTFGKMSSTKRRLMKSPQTSAIMHRVLNAYTTIYTKYDKSPAVARGSRPY